MSSPSPKLSIDSAVARDSARAGSPKARAGGGGSGNDPLVFTVTVVLLACSVWFCAGDLWIPGVISGAVGLALFWHRDRW